MHPSDDPHAEEAELRDAQGGQGAFDEWPRGHRLHSRRGPQFAGTQHRVDSRRSGERFARCALSHRARHARRRRRGEAPREPLQIRREASESCPTNRPLAKDGKSQNTLVSRLVNTVMCSGKKSTAQRIVYGAFDTISEKNPASNPIEILQRAVDNAKPRIETKPRRVGGATYQVPLEIPAERQNALALRWIVDFADAKKGTPMKVALATEILEAFQGQGNAIRKRDEVHKMAQANKAFAHFRW